MTKSGRNNATAEMEGWKKLGEEFEGLSKNVKNSANSQNGKRNGEKEAASTSKQIPFE